MRSFAQVGLVTLIFLAGTFCSLAQHISDTITDNIYQTPVVKRLPRERERKPVTLPMLQAIPVALQTSTFAPTGTSIPDAPSSSIPQAITNLEVRSSSPTELGHSTTFTTTISTGTDVTYLWDFGDGRGTGSGGSSFSYSYQSPGIYTVTVIANNNVSLMSDTVVVTVTLLPGPTPSGTVLPQTPTTPLPQGTGTPLAPTVTPSPIPSNNDDDDDGDNPHENPTDDSLPVITFNAQDYRAQEWVRSTPITLVLSTMLPASELTETVQVDLVTSEGVVIPVSIPPLTKTFMITVPVEDDSIANEDDELILLALANAQNATIDSAKRTARLTVIDDDPPPSLFFTAPTYSVNEGSREAQIGVSLSTLSAKKVAVTYATADDTALAGEDYEARQTILTIQERLPVFTFTIPILDDRNVEDDETIILTLSNGISATAILTPAKLTIIDDDIIPFTVTTTLDKDDGICSPYDPENQIPGEDCSLREAIKATNAMTAGGANITFIVAGTINLTGTLPDLTNQHLTIDGPGPDLLTIARDTGGDYRIFTIDEMATTVVISGVTITNGRVTTATSEANGGGIYNKATLTINNAIIDGNSAVGDDGVNGSNGTGGGTICGNNGEDGSHGIGGNGGGIYNNDNGILTINNTLISNNIASGGNGGDGGDGEDGIGEGVCGGNGGNGGNGGGNGGGIFNSNLLIINNTTISDNTATGGQGGFGGLGGQGSGALSGNGGNGGDGGGNGGGIYNDGTLTLDDTVIQNNLASAAQSPGGTGGDSRDTGVAAGNGGSGGNGGGNGGGIFNSDILRAYSSVTIINNSSQGGNGGNGGQGGNGFTDGGDGGNGGDSGNGGGIYSNGTLTISPPSVSNNSAIAGNGGIGGDGGDGGFGIGDISAGDGGDGGDGLVGGMGGAGGNGSGIIPDGSDGSDGQNMIDSWNNIYEAQ